MPRKNSTELIATIGIDIGKNTFHLIGLDERGAIVMQTKLSRSQLGRRLVNVPRCLIGMEACSGAHFTHDGPEQMLHKEAVYITAATQFARLKDHLATHGRDIHLGTKRPKRHQEFPSAIWAVAAVTPKETSRP